MDLDQITYETINISKAQTGGITSGTGIKGVDLSDLISLIPVPTDFRDELPRTGPNMGSDKAQWEVLLNVNNTQPKPSVAFDAAGPIANISQILVQAAYAPMAMGYTVTRDAIAKARNYANAQSIAIYNAINQWKIAEDKMGMGGQAFPLARPAAPTLGDVTTGGSIPPSTTMFVAVAARTGSGYYYCNGDGTGAGNGNSQANTASITTSTVVGNTHSVTASTASVVGAVCYDWFQSPTGAGGSYHYYTTTTIPSVTMTSVITVNQTPPTATLPDLSTTTPTINTAADNGSAGTGAGIESNGLLASITGDYVDGSTIVQHGSGLNSNATLIDAAGSQFTVSGGGIQQIDNLNKQYYNTTKLGPSAYMVSAQEANSLSAIVLNTPGAVTYLTMDDGAGRGQIVAGGKVGSYVNRVTGKQTPIKVYPNMPPGTLIAKRDSVPWPNSGVTRTLEMRCLDDLYNYVYGSDRAHGGPREDGEARAVETLINRAPVVFGVIQSIQAT
jgi:hypothetical protein